MSQPAPAISVVLTTFRRPAMLAEAIAGIVSQTYRDFELLVISDGPSAESADVAARMADPRVRHIATAAHAGCPAPARNLGIAHARGGLIAFCDDDDIWEPSKLERQTAQLAAHSRAILSFTGLRN